MVVEVDFNGTEKDGANRGAPVMIYHDILGSEFEGDTALEVIQELYKKSLEGVSDWPFEEWEQYQIDLCAKLCGGETVENLGTEGNAQEFLDIQVKYGALISGPKPPEDRLKHQSP